MNFWNGEFLWFGLLVFYKILDCLIVKIIEVVSQGWNVMFIVQNLAL
jgi:hypothetical protein